MHRYHLRPARPEDRPDLADTEFTSASDVAGFAAYHPGIGRVTGSDVWHLDDDGRVTCWSGGGAGASVVELAQDPVSLLRSRMAGLADGGCGANWLIIESRPRWYWEDEPTPAACDELAFTLLRDDLAEVGVRLLDCIVFDDDGHWWSMREATGAGLGW